MAVYTSIASGEAQSFVAQYDIGAYRSHEGIVKGVSNSNFHLFTNRGRYILTLFEPRRVNEADLPYFYDFAAHLAANGITCPQAIAARNGDMVGTLGGKPAAILEFLQGEDIAVEALTADHCAQAGMLAARMHQAAQDFTIARANSMGLRTWRALTDKIAAYAGTFRAGLRDDLYAELDFLEENWPRGLPQGNIHADMFPDNVFFQEDRLTAVIDFYFSCTDFYVFDLAITINAWCFSLDGTLFRRGHFDAFMKSYQARRPLVPEEKAALQIMARGSAFRTLVSRLEEYCEYDPATALMQPHDPAAYLARLGFHQENDIACYL